MERKKEPKNEKETSICSFLNWRRINNSLQDNKFCFRALQQHKTQKQQQYITPWQPHMCVCKEK